MKRKVLAGILMLALTVGMLTGRGKKEVEYGLVEGTEANDAGSLAQYKNMENWTDEWTYTDKNGFEQTLKLNVEIVVPDLEDMRVVETERYGTDMEFWKTCMDSFYGNDSVYYYADFEHWSKEQIEENMKKLADELDPADVSTWPEYTQEQYWNAPDEPVVVEEFGFNNTLYVAEKNGLDYYVSLAPGSMGIYLSIEEDFYSGPESFRDYNTVDRSNLELGDDIPNECKYTEEEAKAIAETYLNDIGLGSLECNYSRENLWRGSMKNDTGYHPGDEYVNYGYTFGYGTGVDGIAFSTYPNFREAFSEETNSGGVWISVTDEGIIEIGISEPETIREMSGPVDLLPLDNVKEIMENEAMENSAKYGFDPNRTVNKLQLVYFAVKSKTEAGVIKYIPVWVLSCVVEQEDVAPEYYFSMLVNAIDGSIIYP